MKTTLTLASTLTLGLLATANATIVYQNTFDDAEIADNTSGIGGGLSQFTASSGSFSNIGGSLSGDTSTNNRRAVAFSTSSFDLSDGFTLNFVATAEDIGAASANRFAVGLAAEGATFDLTASQGRNFLADQRAVYEAVGINLTTDFGSGLLGVVYNDGTGDINSFTAGTAVDASQTIAANTELDITLTVVADGSYSYSINGATASTGPDFGLDLSQNYHFATYYQDNESTEFAISEVTLTALDSVPVPEPSSTALLGLGGLALLMRRKK